jgi:hypothetical protein
MIRAIVAMTAVLLGGGCAGNVAVGPVGRDPPANPGAEAGVGPPAFAISGAKSAQARAATTRSAGPMVYTCVMHPEVVSDHPGNCPKCGMRLVVKEER